MSLEIEINEELISYLEELSCLSLSDDEKQRLTDDLVNILSSMAKLAQLDTENALERSHPFDNFNAFREDLPQASFPRELILRNAPDRNDEMLVVPITI